MLNSGMVAMALGLLMNCGTVGADVIMDQVDVRAYDAGRGNAIGGNNLFGDGPCFALQICDDIRTTSGAYIITEVQVANIFLEGYHQVADVRVSVYADLGGVPGEEPVYSERVSRMRPGPAAARPRVTNEWFEDHVGNLYGVLTSITGLWIPLEPDTGLLHLYPGGRGTRQLGVHGARRGQPHRERLLLPRRTSRRRV